MNTTLKLLLFLLTVSPIALFAQDEDYKEPSPWVQRDRKTAKPLPYEFVREADVMWSKNIWRTIDMREKMNLPFGYPQKPLIEILHRAAIAGTINAYDPAVDNADQFKKLLTPSEVAVIGSKTDTMEIINPVTGEPETKIITNPLTWDKITKFKVKEVWFFDTKTSSMQVRILGIAPVMEDFDAAGNYRGDMTMYWLYYPDLRDMLAKEEVFNPNNDQKSLSWDDVFEARMFESYIYKESNVYDRAISEYATGVDLQRESDRIKQKNFEYEHDLWDY
jgi:gliding motility associated protien GldN